MMGKCCAGFIGFLVFVALAAGICFGPVTLKVTSDMLDELDSSVLPCDYCQDYVYNVVSTSMCCTLDTKHPNCQDYQYCQAEKLSTRRVINGWRISGTIGIVADGLFVLCGLCLCLGNCGFCCCLNNTLKSCLRCFEGSCNWCFVGGRMFCKLCPTFRWTDRDEQENKKLLEDQEKEEKKAQKEKSNSRQKQKRKGQHQSSSQNSRRSKNRSPPIADIRINDGADSDEEPSPKRSNRQGSSATRRQKQAAALLRLQREQEQEDARQIYEEIFRQAKKDDATKQRNRTKPRFRGNTDGTDCAICSMEIHRNDEWKRLSCGHLFHEDCVHQQFRTNNNRRCPTCNAPHRGNQHKTHHFHPHR